MKNKLKSKKAIALLIPLSVFITFLVLSIATIMLYDAYDKLSGKKTLGVKQFDILNAYQKSENALFYIDQSAKYSAQRALSDLGFIAEDLKDKSSKKLFEFAFKQYLDAYLKAYLEMDMPLDNYDILIEGNKIIGTATQNLEFGIYSIEEKDNQPLIGRYSIKPSFTISIE